MSQINRIIRCPVCEVEISEGARVCFACGHLIEAPSIKDESAVNMPPQSDDKIIIPEVKAAAPTRAQGPDGGASVQATEPEGGILQLLFGRLAGRALVFLASLIMLLLVSLAPLSYARTVDDVSGHRTLAFTALETVRIASYATDAYSERQLQRTDEYKEYLILIEEATAVQDGLVEGDLPELLGDISRLSFYLTLMGKEATLDFDMAVAAVVSVILLALVGLFFAVSLVSLVLEVLREFLGLGIKADPHKASVSLLWLSVALLPLCGYAHLQLSYFGLGAKLGAFSSGEYGLSAGFKLLVAVGVIGALYTVVYHLIPMIKRNGFKIAGRAKSAVISVCVALVMLLSLLSPLVSVKLANPEFPSQTTSFKVSANDLFYTTGADISYYSKTSSKSNLEKIDQTIASAFEGNGTGSTDTLLNDLIIGVRRMDNSMLYLTLQVLVLVFLFVLSVLACSMVRSYLLGKKGRGLAFLKILSMLLSVATAVVAIIFVFIARGAVTNDLSYVMAVGIAAAPILLIVSAVAMAFSFRVKASRDEEIEYDEPDATYLPYVIHVRKKTIY